MVKLFGWIALLSAQTIAIEALALEFKKFPWLVRVESTYQESAGPQTYVGYGVLIQAESRLFVATAAHLSQGGVQEGRPSLRLSHYDERLKSFVSIPYNLRVAHNRRDIEVIEIQPSPQLQPLASWQKASAERENFMLEGELKLLPEWNKSFDNFQSLAPAGYTALALQSFVPAIGSSETTIESPIKNWRRKSLLKVLLESDSFFLRQRILTGIDQTDGELVSATPIQPGMSGLPLIIKYPDFAVVAGLAASGSRNFGMGWFATAAQIIFTLKLALKLDGGMAIAHPIYWYSEAGLLYRKGEISNLPPTSLGEPQRLSFKEVIFSRKKTGNGIRADGGTPSTQSQQPDLDPGIILQKNADATAIVTAIEAQYKDKKYLMSGDIASLNWILNELFLRNISLAQLTFLSPNEPLAPRMWLQVLRSLKINVGPRTVRTTLNLDQLNPINVNPASRRSLQAPTQFSYLENNGIEVNIKLPEDSLIFTLNANGGLGKSVYTPEIEVSGSVTKATYRIELAGLLMISPATYNIAWDNTPEVDFWRAKIPNPTIHFRIRRIQERLSTEFLLFN